MLAAALATAALLLAIAAIDGPNPMAAPRRGERLFRLGVLAFGFAGLIALPGVVLTVFYLRRPFGWLRGAYRVLLFLLVVAYALVFSTGATMILGMFLGFCLECDLEVWWIQTIMPASLFIVLAPPARAFLARQPAWHQTQRSLHRRAGLLRDYAVASLWARPLHGATFPGVTLWLAAVPWLPLLMGRLMVGLVDGRFSHPMIVAVPALYSAGFYATLIVTPLLGYLMLRYLRHMPRPARVWALAGLLAGMKGYADAFSAYLMFR